MRSFLKVRNHKRDLSLTIVVTILAVLITLVVNLLILKPTYKSSLSMVVFPSSNASTDNSLNYNNTLMYENLVKTYCEFAKSRTVAEDVISDLNLNISVSKFSSMLSVAPKPNTQFLVITVTDTNQAEATKIADKVSEDVIKVSTNILSNEMIKVLDSASPDNSSLVPPAARNTIIAFFVGLIISLGLVCLLESIDKNDDKEIS